MNLHEELAQLARSAPPVAEVDLLIRRARHTKAKRAIAAPLAVVLVTLVVFLPNWSSQGAQPVQPTETRSFLVLRNDGPIASFPALNALLVSRALALGLISPHVSLIDSRTVELSVTGLPAERLLRAVAQSHRLHVRKVLSLTGGKPDGPLRFGPASTLDAVIAKLGEAYQVALNIQDPSHLDAGDGAKLAVFGELTPAEVEVLPAQMQFNVPDVTCAQLFARPTSQGTPLDQRFTTCQGETKFLLDGAKLTNDDVASAQGSVDQSIGTGFVDMQLTPAGRVKLTELSTEAYQNSGPTKCDASAQGDQERCLIGLSLGPRLLSAPEVQGILSSNLPLFAGGNVTREQMIALATAVSAKDAALALTVVEVRGGA
ncbi:hypothetical protein Rhe02_50640 [Rhizocola hellebori]|uniref:Uncharacterized protein n=1 Tax=Rhizocola hellebori TaxID=1392758 RepID=A0A8J3QC36_9ACTN|nr:hypothetical protein [Rhizocola hellebori]GIH06997.1 hypothetical protein Rhe02_50640 [Rhizocola hellebori]